MALSASATLSASVQDVVNVFTNEEFIREISRKVGGEIKNISLEGDVNGAFVLTIERTLPSRGLPDMAKNFLGDHMTLTQTENWGEPGADGSRKTHVTISVSGAPLSVSAIQTLTPVDGQTAYSAEGEISSPIPMVGKKISQAAEPIVSKAFDLQTRQAAEWLAR